MNPTAALRRAGQSVWIDNVTRDLLESGTLSRYIAEYSVTGLTSNPTIYDKAIAGTRAYDSQIRAAVRAGRRPEDIFFELALDDLRRAADALRPIFARTRGVDGWVSLEISPLLAHDASASIQEAIRLYGEADRPNVYIKIPGTPAGLLAAEEAIVAGVPVNMTLLFTPGHYLAAAQAYVRAIERRVEVGLDPSVSSVASVFVSRWDAAAAGVLPRSLDGQLGVAVSGQTYAVYRRLLDSDRWLRLANEGARPQRLLWASTGTKDPGMSDVRYVTALAAPQTVDTMPEATLRAFADHGVVGELLAPDGGSSLSVLEGIRAAGIDVSALGQRLQDDGTMAFVRSWEQLLARIAAKAATTLPVG